MASTSLSPSPSRFIIATNILTASRRVQELVPAQPDAQGAPERVRNTHVELPAASIEMTDNEPANSIKKPKTQRYPSLNGTDPKFRRNHRHALHGTAKALVCFPTDRPLLLHTTSKRPISLTTSAEGVQGGQEGDCLNIFLCLFSGGARRLGRTGNTTNNICGHDLLTKRRGARPGRLLFSRCYLGASFRSRPKCIGPLSRARERGGSAGVRYSSSPFPFPTTQSETRQTKVCDDAFDDFATATTSSTTALFDGDRVELGSCVSTHSVLFFEGFPGVGAASRRRRRRRTTGISVYSLEPFPHAQLAEGLLSCRDGPALLLPNTFDLHPEDFGA